MEQQARAHWRNWSGFQQSRPQTWAQPGTEDELASLVRQATTGVRVAGAGHSFSALVPTENVLVDLAGLSGVQQTLPTEGLATCGAGTCLAALGEPLWQQQLGLANQGDIDAQSLAGACATGTHGTGRGFGCLSTFVQAFRLVTAAGEVLECDRARNEELFAAGRVSLGMLGVLSQLTVACIPSFYLHERTFALPFEECLERSAELAAQHRHFEFWHFPYSGRALVKTLDETAAAEPTGTTQTEKGETLFRLMCNLGRWFPRLNPAMQRAAMQWYPGQERSDRAYRVFPSQRSVRFNEMEYEVPEQAGPACMRELVTTVRQQRAAVSFPIEYRHVQGDDIWLSPFYHRDSVAISVHEDARLDHEPLFRLLEPIFWKYEGRPHWGKLHSLRASRLQQLYPRWNDVMELRRELDPTGKFLNQHLRTLVSTE